MKYILSLIALCFLAFSAFGQSKENPKQNSSAKSGMVSVSGKTFGSAELNGKVVVLNFWYTSCPPCLKEIPELNKLVEEFKGKDVVFLGLATDNKQKIEKFLKEKPFNYEIIPSATQFMFKFLEPDKEGNLRTAFPTHIVVDRTGKKVLYETGIKGIEAVRQELNRQFKTEGKSKTADKVKKSD
jgi:thiol-disulfide isomerase/thioredoxin